jgi:ribonucleoside-diphosphate reductase beta chain
MEGVSLFSSFAILLSFSMRNLLKGVGEIIKYSIRDEDIHSIAGIWLYNQLVFEYPEILDDELKADIYTGAEQVVKLEIAFLKSAFQQGEIEGVAEYDIEEFIKNRANGKLLDLNLKPIFTVDLEAVERIESWFLPLIGGASRTDGFATRVTEYAKSFEVDKIDWSLI